MQLADVVSFMRWVVSAAFVLTAIGTWSLHRRERVSGTAWLAGAFGSLALAIWLGRTADLVSASGGDQALATGLRQATLAVAAVYPLMLVWFTDAFRRVNPLTQTGLAAAATGVVYAVASGAALSQGSLRGDLTTRDGLVFAVFAAVWLTAHGEVARHLWRGGAPRSLVRVRTRILAVSFLALGSVVLLAGVDAPSVQLGVHLVALAAATGAWVAVRAPRWFLDVQPSVRRVHDLELTLVRAADPYALLDDVLVLACDLTGAEQAWITRGDRLVAAREIGHERARELSRSLPTDPSDAGVCRVAVPGEDGDATDWLVAVPFEEGWLVARSAPFSPLVSAHVTQLVERLAGFAAGALPRSRALAAERRAHRRVAHVAELKDDFLSTVSHEIRTPLTVIKAAFEVLAVPGRFDEPTRQDLLERGRRKLEDLTRLLEGFERLADATGGSTDLDIERFDLREAVDLAVRVSRTDHPSQIVRIDVPRIRLHQDRTALVRVLVELLRNAAQYAPGGPVTVTAERDGDDVEIHVSDDGPGVPSGEQQRVFEPFHRVGPVLTREPGGAGIGLTLVRQLAGELTGTCWLVSEEGHGTEVVLRVPSVNARSRLPADGAVDATLDPRRAFREMPSASVPEDAADRSDPSRSPVAH